MSETIHADIPLSFFEYRVLFREPMMYRKLYSEVSSDVYRALREWNVGLENVTHKLAYANPSELSVSFALFGGRVGLTVGLGYASLLVRDPNWSETKLVESIAKAGVDAVVASGDVAVGQQRASIVMHLKPASGPIKDIVARLIRPADSLTSGGDVRAYGFSMYRGDATWVVDASVLYPEALFVRIEDALPADTPFEQVAARLYKEEQDLLGLLRLEVA